MTHEAHIQLVEGWTPANAALLATICNDEPDAWYFDTVTEALLALFLLETHNPRLVRGFNFIPVPHHSPDPQFFFTL
jgi:hypothetical protein